MQNPVQFQSNSLRGEFMRSIMDSAVKEIFEDIKPMFGPGATDAFIIKDGQTYYTRDGKEVMESLIFDNELALYVHHILYQAVYNQGKNVGDGSTTLAIMYCLMYLMARIEGTDANRLVASGTINDVRNEWKVDAKRIIERLEAKKVPLTDELLKSMLYTCTQDAELSAKIYTNLHDAIMAGAYIVPRKSNIATDFQMTSYTRPTLKVTRQFSIKPMKDVQENSVVLYCNGMLDMAHSEVLANMATQRMMLGDAEIDLSIIILCHGVSDRTRLTVREFVSTIKANGWDVSKVNNIAIYTMDDYRAMTMDELEDVTAIITDEPTIDGLVQSITYENLLYQTFRSTDIIVPELESFDIDIRLVDRMHEILSMPYTVMFDPIEGMAIDKRLGPIAAERYEMLRREIDEEKSPIRKLDLNKRLRRTFGTFIDVEVGSTLLKDSQRKFELILDALLSSTEAAKDGVLVGNSILHAARAANEVLNLSDDPCPADVIYDALLATFEVLNNNIVGEDLDHREIVERSANWTTKIMDDDYDPRDYRNGEWNRSAETAALAMESIEVSEDLVPGGRFEFIPTIVEPFGVIKAIIENSVLPIELAMTRMFHVTGSGQLGGMMGNYVDQNV